MVEPQMRTEDITTHQQLERGPLDGYSTDNLAACNGLMMHANGQSKPPSTITSVSTPFNLNRPAPDLDYLTQLLKDKKQLSAFPNVFTHVERLLDEEINRVRIFIFQCEFTHEPMNLPDPAGEIITKQEKVFVPVKAYPEYNFVGRILGPRGMTAKQLEAETGCKIMVRGKGSMRDKNKEDLNRGKANWEHLQEDLHVLVQCEDTSNRIEIKMARAIEEVKKLLVPSPEGEDELKKKQLMELAIINGTYRSASSQNSASQSVQLALTAAAAAAAKNGTLGLQLVPTAVASSLQNAMPQLAGAPLIMQSAVGNRTAAASNNSQAVVAAAAAQNAAALVAAQQQAAQTALAMQLAATQGLTAPPNPVVDYQQLLLGSMHQYDSNTLLALQQHQIAAMFQQVSGAAGGVLAPTSTPAEYAAVPAAEAPGSILSHQRRFLGQSREHPYASASGKRDMGSNGGST